MDAEHRPPLLAGRYRLLDQLGSGGMGVVWRAFDELLDREVAAKEVRAPEHLREQDVRILYARLEQEARAAARVSHPNVITVHDVVEHDGRPWIVMELVRGRSLADVLQHEGVLLPKEAAKVGSMVLQALRSAHSSGVLHRDVKPANVLLEPGGRVVLTDFGIALVEGSGTLTRTGDLVGSPDFLAPERALGQRPGAPSDLWSLGATLYAAIEGVSPFRRGSPLSTLQAVVQDDPPPPRRAGPLTPLLEGLLRKDPRTRMGSAEAQRMLDAVAAGHMTTQPGWSGGGYVPTERAAPAPQPPPPATPPAQGNASLSTAGSGPVVPLYSSPAYSPAPPSHAPDAPSPAGYAPAGGHPVGAGYPAGGAYPVVAPAPDGRRRLIALLLGSVLALLLIGGGTAAVLAARGTGDSGRTPSGVSSATSGPAGGGGYDSPAPSAGSSAYPSPGATTAPAGGSSAGPCNGGWLQTCGTG
ncbi:serine/threonine-protein kinase [Streptomyces olivoreticuli]|uniref:serine/threonine-protein kinase n=1 Tax=Streptomyces olivoreticuli TaxID=68246 RepID=UPI000E285132|nr:serine/threonine-protein kinase [Streptomyces olivoreticuli]